jgi:hypothetical protein
MSGWDLNREVTICSCQEQNLRAHRIIATSKFKDANGGVSLGQTMWEFLKQKEVKGNVVIKYGRTNVTDDVTGLPIKFRLESKGVLINISYFYFMLSKKNANCKRIKTINDKQILFFV